jgi:hypothetical protein
MGWEFDYTVNTTDYNSHASIVTDYNYDFDDELDMEELVEHCAREYFDHVEYAGWKHGEIHNDFYIWIDKDTYKHFKVWCKLVPRFMAKEVK